MNPKSAVAVDTETTGLDHWGSDNAFAVAMCDDEGQTWYCQWPVDPFTRIVKPVQSDIEHIKHFCENESLAKVFHNAKFDTRMLAKLGIKVNGVIDDTHIAARVCNNLEPSLGLKSLARKYLDIPEDDEEELIKAVKKYTRAVRKFNSESPFHMKLGEEYEQDYWLPRYFDDTNNLCEFYCTQDVVRTMALFLMYKGIMDEDEYLKNTYEKEMYQVWPIVNRMELRGMAVHPEKVQAELLKAQNDQEYFKNEMIEAILEEGLRPFPNGEDPSTFNPGSALQLRRVLYLPRSKGGLGLFTKRRSKGGDFSTDKNAIRGLMDVKFVQDLSQYRAAVQVMGIALEKFVEHEKPDPLVSGGKCIHPGLNQCGTVTGRFSCSNPNLQQVGNPKTAHNVMSSYNPRFPLGPRPGYYWYSADYAQQELRLFASISQNPFLLTEIRAGNDPNSALANKAWGGKGNPAALKAAGMSLDLGKEKPTSDLVAAAWDELGWNEKASREFGSSSKYSLEVLDGWLAKFDYDIVKAEKSVGRSNSRGRAKCVMFAKIYGGGPSSVTELLFCSLEEAAKFMGDYDRAMPEVNHYIYYLSSKAKKDGFIINPYGRKVRVDSEFAYRSVNYMIQSSAADQVKDSMIKIDKYFRDCGVDAHILLPVHDELIFEVAQKHAYKWLVRGIVEHMSDNGGRIDVPTPAEIGRIREAWSQKEPINFEDN